LSIADRDLRWSEWVRLHQKEVIEDLLLLKKRWKTRDHLSDRERLLARWIMWLLTSSVRVLRDHATHALYYFGCIDPKALFTLTIESLGINDPYIPERMLAAAYGISMSLWADPRGDRLRESLPVFANELVRAMWVPGAPHSTCHALMQDYSRGAVSLALKVSADAISSDVMCYLQRPFQQISSPFRPVSEIDESVSILADRAIHMDFGNYTIGGLIPGRGNYDYKHKEYCHVRRQIEDRIVELGFSPERFSQVDTLISDAAWHSHSRGTPPADRYGKKYSWIAYFEMYGIRLDKRRLPDWRDEERTPDVDIDPSFPESVPIWEPTLPDVFTSASTDISEWLSRGPTPAYNHLLQLNELDGEAESWILLDGYVEQVSEDDGRRIFTFLRGVFVSKRKIDNLIRSFESIDYPGNYAIPGPGSDIYTFAGEIPWSPNFGHSYRDRNGNAKRHLEEAFDRFGSDASSKIVLEIPIHEYAWESHHSELNQVGGVTTVAPALCEGLGLSNRIGEWDLYDQTGRRGTVCRKWKSKNSHHPNDVLYLRHDLLSRYLNDTRQTLVWLMWGERGYHHSVWKQHESQIHAACRNYCYIHRSSEIWESDCNKN
jgi:hypothetical protein